MHRPLLHVTGHYLFYLTVDIYTRCTHTRSKHVVQTRTHAHAYTHTRHTHTRAHTHAHIYLQVKPYSLTDLSPQQLVACSPNPDDCGGIGGCDVRGDSGLYQKLGECCVAPCPQAPPPTLFVTLGKGLQMQYTAGTINTSVCLSLPPPTDLGVCRTQCIKGVGA